MSFEAGGQGINNILRSLDDNHLLATDTTDWKVFRKIKEIPLTRKNDPVLISLGGELREQLRLYNHLNYGDADPDKDVYLLQRYLAHADLSVSRNLRFFSQLNSTHVSWKNSVGLNDRDYLGVMQLFTDFSIPELHSRLRFGRQELFFGAERILGTRDGPNNRQTYDGLRYTLNLPKATGDFLIVHPVAFKPGFFDNSGMKSFLIVSGYWTLFPKNKRTLEVYYFGTNRKVPSEGAYAETETRHSFGARGNQTTGSVYYDVEATLQLGSREENNIYGWHMTSIVGHKWKNSHLLPKLQLKGAVYSGNKDSTDNQINTFYPISAKPPVNDMLPVGPSNIFLLVPEGEIKAKNLTIMLRYFLIWRVRRTDGLYSIDLERMVRPPDKPGEDNGHYTAGGPVAEINYTANKHFSVSVQSGYFVPGVYVKSTGAGKDLQSMILKVYYRF
ncbi:MAG: alginate export family protein [Bacteroidales bacterium]|nr:alginate export family protein [Bacteroidales bacterium]